MSLAVAQHSGEVTQPALMEVTFSAPLFRKGQWACLQTAVLQPSVIDLGSQGAAPGSCHAWCLQTHTSCWLIHGDSFSGCLHNGIVMSSPVFRWLVVTAREVACLIYYTVSNLQGSPGCQLRLGQVCGKCLVDGVCVLHVHPVRTEHVSQLRECTPIPGARVTNTDAGRFSSNWRGPRCKKHGNRHLLY